MKKFSLEQKNDIFLIILIVSSYLLYFISILIISSIGGKL